MNKEITCRMIDGKPVVSFRTGYTPKQGDIVTARYGHTTCLGICGSNYEKHYRLSFSVNVGDCGVHEEPLYLATNTTLGDDWRISKATPEESEVMLHILSENGYELKGDTVVKKRWIPKVGEEFYYLVNKHDGIQAVKGCRFYEDDSGYLDCFRTAQSAQSACDKLNELRLTLPQE